MSGSRGSGSGDVVVYHPRRKMVLPLVLAAVIAVIAADLVSDPTPNDVIPSRLAVAVIGWVALVFFGACLVVLVARAASHRPALVIQADGILNLTNMASVPFLAWGEISELREVSIVGKPFLVIDVQDPEGAMARCRSPLRRALIRKNLRLGFGVSSIAEMMIPGTLDDLRQKLEPHIRTARQTGP